LRLLGVGGAGKFSFGRGVSAIVERVRFLLSMPCNNIRRESPRTTRAAAQERRQTGKRRAMTTFDDREKAFENKYAHDAEMQFKASARRNKLLGLWAAELLGLTGADADSYARDVVVSDLEESGDEDVYRKVKGDLDSKGVAVSEVELRTKMSSLVAIAKAQVFNEAD
jgi:hypothetical protein